MMSSFIEKNKILNGRNAIWFSNLYHSSFPNFEFLSPVALYSFIELLFLSWESSFLSHVDVNKENKALVLEVGAL